MTENRRADISPYVQVGSIDPHLGVIRVDRSSDGTPLATGTLQDTIFKRFAYRLLSLFIYLLSVELCHSWNVLGTRSNAFQRRHHGWCMRRHRDGCRSSKRRHVHQCRRWRHCSRSVNKTTIAVSRRICLSFLAGSACAGKPNYAGAPVIASAVQRLRDDTPVTSDDVGLVSASTVVDFGETQGNLTLARVANCTQGGPLDICSLCRVVSRQSDDK